MTNEDVWIEGARIALRDAQMQDLDVLAYWLQPEQQWQNLDGPFYEQPKPEEIARLLRERRALVTSQQKPVPRKFLSIAALDTNLMLGQVTCHEKQEVGNELGLNIVIYNPDMWGYGLGYESLGLWIEYLFGYGSGLMKLDLRTWSGNKGMVRLAQKLGFAEVARDRKSRLVNGRKYDGIAYTVARDTWQQRFPRGFASSLMGEQ